MGPQSEGLGSNSGSATSLLTPGASVFSSVKGINSVCLADVVWPRDCPGAPRAPVQIWRPVGLEEGGLGGGRGPRRLGGQCSQPPLFSELPGGFDAITRKLVIKRLWEALRKTSGIDISEANFTSGAMAPASSPLSCLLWDFTASCTFAQYASALCFTSVICHPFPSEA